MTKLTAYRISLVLSGFIIVMLSVILYLSCRRYSALEERMANQNVMRWQGLYFMTQTIDNNVKTLEDANKFALYQNQTVNWLADILYPRCIKSGDELGNFLKLAYDPFVQDIAYGNLPEEKRQEALKLYLEINGELGKLCENVLNCAGNDASEQAELLDDNSEASEKIIEEIQILTQKYKEKIQSFN